MAKIVAATAKPYMERMAASKEDRRKPHIVLNIVNDGPSSRGSTYWNRVASCPREDYFANVLGWASTSYNDPLDWGLVWHKMLEEYYTAKLRAQEAHPCWVSLSATMPRITSPEFFQAGEVEARQAAFSVLAPFETEPGYSDMYKRLSGMLEDYFKITQLDRWQVVGVEFMLKHTFQTQAGPLVYSTKMDLAIVDHMGAQPYFWPVEHKTTYEINDKVRKAYSFHPQVLGQSALCRLLFNEKAIPPMLGHYVNLTSKKKGEAQMYLTQRMPVHPTGDQLQFWYEHHIRQLYARPDDIALGLQMGNLHQCSRKFGLCEFFDICSADPYLRTTGLTQPPAGFERVSFYDNAE